MAKADIAALLALGAALFIAIGDVMHQRSAHEVTDEPVGHVRAVPPAAARPEWWLGSIVAAVGFVLQAAALGLGSVLLVQALLVTLAAVRAADQRQSAPPPADPLGMDLGGAAGGMRWPSSSTVGNPTAGSPRASLETWAVVVAVLGTAAGRLRGGCAAWRRAAASAVLLAFVSGSLWGVFAVLTKGVVHLLGDGSRAAAALTGAVRLGGWWRSPAPPCSSRRFGPGR